MNSFVASPATNEAGDGSFTTSWPNGSGVQAVETDRPLASD